MIDPTVEDLAKVQCEELVEEMSDFELSRIEESDIETNAPMVQRLDVDQAGALLGYRPDLDLDV